MGSRKLPYSYANKTALDGRVVEFSIDIVAGNTPPTIAVNEELWDKDELPVPTETVADHEFAKLQPQDMSIPNHHREQQQSAFPAHTSRR